MKKILTDSELRNWGERLGEDWGGISATEVLELMRETAGNEYDAGEADWEFDISDAQQMIDLMNS